MNREQRENSTESVCPRCAVGCSLAYDERSGRATGVENAPVNREGRLCPKGIGAFDSLDAEDRLTRPLARIDGDLTPVSWATAYDRIERAFAATIDEYGADALAFFGAPRCTNEENYLLQKLARALGTNNVDNRARICHRSVTRAMTERLGSGAMTTSLDDLAVAESFLVVGSNPAAQQPIAFNSSVRPAVTDGATLIHVDPRTNRTTRTADVHLAPRPGTDALVVTLLTAAIHEEGLIDRSFVDERTTGFDAFEAAIAAVDVAAGAERVGVDPDALREAARAFGGAEHGAVLVGTGVEADDHCGTEAADALLDLVLSTGNLGKPGTGMNPLRGLVNEQGANDVGARPHTLPGYESVTDPETRGRVAREWGVEPPATPGLTEPEAVEAFGDTIHGAFVLAENPAVAKTDTQGVARGFRDLDFLVVQEVSPSETTAYADVVLPASAWAEKGGTVTNLDRRVQRLHPFRAPPGEAKRDFEVLREIGARVTDLPFEYEKPSDVFAEITRVTPLYAGMDYEAIDRGGQHWPFPEGASEGTAILHRDRFANGHRRVPFAPVPVHGTAAPADRPSSGEETGSGDHELVLLTRNQVNETTAGTAADALQIHPTDADYRGVADGEAVVVENGHGRVTRTAHVTDRVSEHTVFLDANAAEPLLSGERTRVRVASFP